MSSVSPPPLRTLWPPVCPAGPGGHLCLCAGQKELRAETRGAPDLAPLAPLAPSHLQAVTCRVPNVSSHFGVRATDCGADLSERTFTHSKILIMENKPQPFFEPRRRSETPIFLPVFQTWHAARGLSGFLGPGARRRPTVCPAVSSLLIFSLPSLDPPTGRARRLRVRSERRRQPAAALGGEITRGDRFSRFNLRSRDHDHMIT